MRYCYFLPSFKRTWPLEKCKKSRDMRFPTMWYMYVRPAKPQTSLRIRAVWSEPLLVAWIFYECYVTDRTSFGFFKIERRLHRLVLVYTCQNATLLEITCHGSNMKPVHFAVSLSSTSCHPRNHNAMANKRFTWTLSEVAQRHIYSTNKLFYTRAHTHTHARTHARIHTQTYQKLSQVKQISSCQPSKLKGKDQESIQSSPKPDQRHHMRKRQKHKKTSHTREPRWPPFPSRWPQGRKELTKSMTNTKHK